MTGWRSTEWEMGYAKRIVFRGLLVAMGAMLAVAQVVARRRRSSAVR